MSRNKGTIYLLHFERPYKHARHYLGYTRRETVDERLERHRSKRGARLLKVIIEAGISFELVRTWEGTRKDERRMKGRRSRVYCPICRPEYLEKRRQERIK